MSYKNMTATELLDISGKPMVMLGGEFTVLRHVSKGIVSEYTWRDGEPVMILFKDVDGRSKTRLGAYLIELKDAFHYADSNGNPSRTLFDHAREACAAMGWDRNDKFAIFNVMTVILEGLPDLIKMPPPPAELERRESISQGKHELTLKLDGRTILERLV